MQGRKEREAEIQGEDGVHDGEGVSRQPADCRIYGVKVYKSEGRNPSDPIVHVDADNHLSYKMNVGEIKRCGSNCICGHWYNNLPELVKDRISHAGRDRQLVIALAERWWDTTHTFHFDNIGEMTMTPKDFSAITGVQVFGRPLEYDMDAHKKRNELLQYFGKRLADISELSISNTYIYREHCN
ncbi:hypothetical protein M0R45_036154 [Rubus argutus]|uniref:Aminotransferase-like plant mobile domain-containing protein n=1 Tax=Rubus argutus TaxID=59490 RepID=A0AAW1VXX1_RUBAR